MHFTHRPSLQPRVPTANEKTELWHALCEEQCFEMPVDGEDTDNDAAHIRNAIEDAAIAVFDHYITTSVGYCGKLMCVIWPSAPEIHDLFIWERVQSGDTTESRLTKINADPV